MRESSDPARRSPPDDVSELALMVSMNFRQPAVLTIKAIYLADKFDDDHGDDDATCSQSGRDKIIHKARIIIAPLRNDERSQRTMSVADNKCYPSHWFFGAIDTGVLEQYGPGSI